MKSNDYDSNEEMYFHWWLLELKEHGYIREIIYQPDSYITSKGMVVKWVKCLKTKTKDMSFSALPERKYTPDFLIVWEEKAKHILHSPTSKNSTQYYKDSVFYSMPWTDKSLSYSVIEVKPTFDQNNMSRLASININFVWEIYRIFISMVKIGNKPESFFAKTFTPQRFLFCDKDHKRKRKIKYPTVTLFEFIENRKIITQDQTKESELFS